MCLSSFIFEVEEDWEENRIATKSHRREEWGLGGKSTIQSNMNDCELITGFLKTLVNEDTLLRTQNVSEQNQKHFLCPGHKICVRNKCCARANGETFVSATLCPHQCVFVCQGLNKTPALQDIIRR